MSVNESEFENCSGSSYYTVIFGETSEYYPVLHCEGPKHFWNLNSTRPAISLSSFLFFLQCFFIPKCRKDYAATHAIIQNISESLKSQRTVQCFVDPTDRMDSAILTQIYGQVTVFHSLFWPTCTLIGGTVIIAMVKLTQYLSIMSERLESAKR